MKELGRPPVTVTVPVLCCHPTQTHGALLHCHCIRLQCPWNGPVQYLSVRACLRYLLTDILRTELGFKGVVVSDWAAIQLLPGNFSDQVCPSDLWFSNSHPVWRVQYNVKLRYAKALKAAFPTPGPKQQCKQLNPDTYRY